MIKGHLLMRAKALVIIMILALTSLASGGQYQIIKKRSLVPNLSCKVTGTPVEFPRGIKITNESNLNIPAGSIVSYHFLSYYGGITTISVPFIGGRGSYFHDNAHAGMEPSSRCWAKVVKFSN
ncbi:MAG: hypothetical protein D6B25_01670 [Desulfobulbaceae bacterium]|nr:MAG: hypothetical protein D6B25_01670 [Desulfobulbaceae bacterium]